ncbi:hypothetical protein AB3N59_06060 [Leptospira sp. WS92.C1]
MAKTERFGFFVESEMVVKPNTNSTANHREQQKVCSLESNRILRFVWYGRNSSQK